MDFEIIEYIDFIIGFLICMVLSLTLYLILTRKKNK